MKWFVYLGLTLAPLASRAERRRAIGEANIVGNASLEANWEQLGSASRLAAECWLSPWR